MKTPFFNISAFIIMSCMFLSCERELTTYELLRSERCESEDVIIDPFFVTAIEYKVKLSKSFIPDIYEVHHVLVPAFISIYSNLVGGRTARCAFGQNL